jgi:hypothetical protein
MLSYLSRTTDPARYSEMPFSSSLYPVEEALMDWQRSPTIRYKPGAQLLLLFLVEQT